MADIGPPTATCRHCGKTGLRQRRGDARWTLHHPDNSEHACRRERVPPIQINTLERQRNPRRKTP